MQTRFVCPLLILWFVQAQWPFWHRLKHYAVTACPSLCLIFDLHGSSKYRTVRFK